MSFEKVLSFKRYMVLNENRTLVDLTNEILSKLERIKQDIVKSGMFEFSEDIRAVVTDIRKIISGSWIGQQKELEKLVLVGYNLADMVDGDNHSKKDTTDFIGVINSCIEAMSSIADKSKSPVNNLAVDKKDIPPVEKADTMVSEPESSDSGFNLGNSPMTDKSSIAPLGGPTDEARPNS